MPGTQTAGTIVAAQSISEASRLSDALLLVAADSLDRAEGMRIALTNQLYALGENQGVKETVEQRQVAAMIEAVSAIEHDCTLMIQRAMRTQPLYPWVKQQPGLGEKQVGRLLAVLGDPYIHYFKDGSSCPRTVNQLWAYTGNHVISTDHVIRETHVATVGGDNNGAASAMSETQIQRRNAGVAPSRRKHERANWNDAARMRAHLVAESCMKQPTGTRYRDVYEAARAKYREAIHAVPCVRCGPKGKPAPAGSPLSLGHQHARGLRAVAKEILRDLWIESKRLHEVNADHSTSAYPFVERRRLALVAS